MRRWLGRLAAVVLVGTMAATWLGTPETVAAHDVEHDAPDSFNTLQAYPFIGNVSGFKEVGGGFTITLQPHAGAKGQWSCTGDADFNATVYKWTNWDGSGERVLSISTLPSVTSTTFPGGMTAGARCWFIIWATSSPDNTYAAQGFDLTDVYWWGDIATADEVDEFPEPTPTPTPTPGATPTPTPIPPTADCEARVGPLYGITKPGVCEVALAPGIYTAVYEWTEDIGLNDQTITLRESDGGTLTPTCVTGSVTYTGESLNVETECTGIDTANTTPDGVEIQITYASHNNASSGGKATLSLYCTGGACLPTPTPTPEPSPSPSPTPTPTPRPPGTIPPDPTGPGFDVCASEYSASEKSMCLPFPEFPDEIGVEMCGPEDADLALCQPVEPWEGPSSGGGGLPGAGSPIGSGTGDSGLTECEPTPVSGKIGYQEPYPVTTIDDLGTRVAGKDPLAGLSEAIGWIGDMIGSLPAHGLNITIAIWNAVVDAIVPGACLGAIIASHWEGMGDTLPLSLIFDAKDAIDGAIGGAGTIAIPGIPLPGGGSIPFPMAEWESHVSPYRSVLGAMVYLAGAVYVFQATSSIFMGPKLPQQLALPM
jgi:hypothetical protein